MTSMSLNLANMARNTSENLTQRLEHRGSVPSLRELALQSCPHSFDRSVLRIFEEGKVNLSMQTVQAFRTLFARWLRVQPSSEVDDLVLYFEGLSDEETFPLDLIENFVFLYEAKSQTLKEDARRFFRRRDHIDYKSSKRIIWKERELFELEMHDNAARKDGTEELSAIYCSYQKHANLFNWITDPTKVDSNLQVLLRGIPEFWSKSVRMLKTQGVCLDSHKCMERLFNAAVKLDDVDKIRTLVESTLKGKVFCKNGTSRCQESCLVPLLFSSLKDSLEVSPAATAYIKSILKLDEHHEIPQTSLEDHFEEAIKEGNLVLIKKLFERGLLSTDKIKWSHLETVVKNDFADLLEFFHKKGVPLVLPKPDEGNRDAFERLGVDYRYCASLMYSLGTNQLCSAKDGYRISCELHPSPLILAFPRKCFSYLLEQPEVFEYLNSIQDVRYWLKYPPDAIVRLLVRGLVNPNLQDAAGCSPLHHLAENPETLIQLRTVLAFPGINLNLRNRRGYTPIQTAVIKNTSIGSFRVLANTPGVDLKLKAPPPISYISKDLLTLVELSSCNIGVCDRYLLSVVNITGATEQEIDSAIQCAKEHQSGKWNGYCDSLHERHIYCLQKAKKSRFPSSNTCIIS